jgi:TRAP-type mannitol/chloroaromatic compound transport system permease small subunit
MLLRFSRLIDAVNERVGRTVYWLILIMTIISTLNAVSRKAFNFSSNAFLEIQWYLFAAVFLLGAGYTLLKDEHVRIDVIVSKFSKKGQIWIDIIGTLLFLLPFTLIILYYGWPYFMLSFQSQEWSSSPGGLIVWPVKLLIPLGFFLLFLQGVSRLIKLIGTLQGKVDMEVMTTHHTPIEDEIKTMLGEPQQDQR